MIDDVKKNNNGSTTCFVRMKFFHRIFTILLSLLSDNNANDENSTNGIQAGGEKLAEKDEKLRKKNYNRDDEKLDFSYIRCCFFLKYRT